MFEPDFYPTPPEVMEKMTNGLTIEGRKILEPSAGKGNLIKHLKALGAAEVLACEINEELRFISSQYAQIIENDFMNVTSDQISHIDAIVMNPPFSADEKHILHAYEIAPAGCDIVALCNSSTLDLCYSKDRKQLKQLIDELGTVEELGECFSTAERKTYTKISLIRIKKAGENNKNEWDGFFMDEEDEQRDVEGIMSYNLVRDLVHRYIESVKIFDDQLEAAERMSGMISGFFSCEMAMTVTQDKKPLERNKFKKELQKSAWKFIFNKLNMQKYSTRGLTEDINKFVEDQEQVPFTMRNIYRMIEIVIGTTGSRMDKALEEVFDRVTKHYDDNRFYLEGWKTNSHYLLNRRFILPFLTDYDKRWPEAYTKACYTSRGETIDDMVKAICFLTGKNYDDFTIQGQHMLIHDTLYEHFRRNKVEWGQWTEWTFFKVRGYKKGTMHFEFIDEKIWADFNQRISKIKGYPLYEHTKAEEKKKQQETKKASVVFSFNV